GLVSFGIYSLYFCGFLAIMAGLSLGHLRALGGSVRRNALEIGCVLAAGALLLVLSADVLGGPRYLPRHDNWKYAFPFFDFFLNGLVESGTLPAWNPYVNAGMPSFLWLNHNFLFNLPHLLSYVLYPLVWRGVTTLQMYWLVLIFGNVMFSLGCYGFFRVLFSNRIAAVYGFVVCLFSGITVGTLHQEQLMASIFYIPWIGLFGVLFFRSGKLPWAVLTALFFGLSLLNHYPHLVFYFWGSVFVSFGVFSREDFAEFIRLNGARVRQFILLAVVIAPLFLLPIALLYSHYKPILVSAARDAQSMGVTASYSQILDSLETNSFNIHTLLHYIYPQTFFAIPQDHQLFGQHRLDNFVFYLGLLPLFFAVFEIFKGKRGYRRPVLLALGMLFLLAMGGNSFVYFVLYKLVPFSNLQRLPLHLANYCNFLLILLSVGGVRTYLETARPDGPAALKEGQKFLALPGLGIYGKYAVLKPILRAVLDETLLFAGMLWAFFWIRRQRVTKTVIGILFFLLIFDLGRYTHFVMVSDRLPLDTSFDFRSGQTKTLPEFKGLFEFEPGKTAYHAMLKKEPVLVPSNKVLMELKEGRDFVSQHAELLKDREKNKELYRSYFLTSKNEQGSAGPGPGKTDVVSFSADRVAFRVWAHEPAYFTYRDNKDDGWSAALNGKRVPLVEAKAFKTVEVGPGENRVVFTYNPPWKWSLHLVLQIFFLGAGGSLIWLYRGFLKKIQRAAS
ncbi:MAG: hypothetical protein HYZ87_01260, partial [Candidatus Omnitrophica bacterium]|nr:hypothetical protein [Candidatus Omnitrophota bacterium]